MSNIQNEKQILEQLVLEILSFGEQCDQQFEQLSERMSHFSVEQRKQVQFDQEFIQKLRNTITEKVKAIIVDIENKELRDRMIEILSWLNNDDQNSRQVIDCTLFEQAFGQIVEGLGQCALAKEKQNQELRLELQQNDMLKEKLKDCQIQL